MQINMAVFHRPSVRFSPVQFCWSPSDAGARRIGDCSGILAAALIVMSVVLAVLAPIASALAPEESSAGGIDVEIETVTAPLKTRMIELRIAGAGADAPAVLVHPGGELPLRDVLHLNLLRPRKSYGPLEVVLADGSTLRGGLAAETTRDVLALNGGLLPDGVKVPLEWVRRISFHATSGIEAADSGGSGTPPASLPEGKDLLITEGDALLTGLVTEVSAQGVRFDDDKLGSVEMPWARIRAVHIAAVEAAPEMDAPLTQIIAEGADGSFLHGDLLAIDRSKLRMRSPLLGIFEISLERLAGVEFRLGRVAYLAERSPIRAKEGNPYTGEALFQSAFHWQKDRNVKGGPLVVGGRYFRRGIGVHSESRLAFRVEPGDRTLQASIGMDAIAQPYDNNPELGSAVFKVLVDGEERYNSGDLNWESGVRRVEVDVSSAKEFELVVVMGKMIHILDRADWCEARVLKD